MRYRTLQLLSTLMNIVIQKELNAVVNISGTILLSVCEASLVTMPFTSRNYVQFFVFGLQCTNCFVGILVILGGFAQMHMRSNDIIRKMKKQLPIIMLDRRERGYRKRFHVSCAIIKVRLGSINYFDSLTPLNCIDFANGQAVQLLLLEKL